MKLLFRRNKLTFQNQGADDFNMSELKNQCGEQTRRLLRNNLLQR